MVHILPAPPEGTRTTALPTPAALARPGLDRDAFAALLARLAAEPGAGAPPTDTEAPLAAPPPAAPSAEVTAPPAAALLTAFLATHTEIAPGPSDAATGPRVAVSAASTALRTSPAGPVTADAHARGLSRAAATVPPVADAGALIASVARPTPATSSEPAIVAAPIAANGASLPATEATALAPPAVTTHTPTPPQGAPASTVPASVPAPSAPPSVQLAQAVLAQGPADVIEVRLDPPQLGRVQIAFDLTGETPRAVVSATQPETLDLLRRGAPVLMEELTAAGLGEAEIAWSDAPLPDHEAPGRIVSVAVDRAAAEDAPAAPAPRRHDGMLDLTL